MCIFVLYVCVWIVYLTTPVGPEVKPHGFLAHTRWVRDPDKTPRAQRASWVDAWDPLTCLESTLPP